jgi:hypothetical protein
VAGGGAVKNAEQEITLYNYFMDAETGYDTSRRVHISGVSTFVQTQVNVSKDGLASADVYTIRIPDESVKERYVTPREYKNLKDKSGFFTLAKGDKVVLGYAKEEEATPAYLESTYGNEMVMTITGVTDNRNKRAPHWKVTGE